jgi:hypothetical protein
MRTSFGFSIPLELKTAEIPRNSVEESEVNLIVAAPPVVLTG